MTSSCHDLFLLAMGFLKCLTLETALGQKNSSLIVYELLEDFDLIPTLSFLI